MPSKSLERWEKERAGELDELEAAHVAVGGSKRGRRFATQQVNHAYAVLLSSQFQGFSRDLHSECVDHIVQAAPASFFRQMLRQEFTLLRKLDKGNPSPENIAADFDRLGIGFWEAVIARDQRNQFRREMLRELNSWRNAIAHQHFDPVALGGTTTLHLDRVRSWRRVCGKLARDFDEVMRRHLAAVVGSAPW